MRGLSMLVAIANHGTKNDGYAKRVIDEYRGMSLRVDIVVLSNLEKEWGEGVEVRVGYPTADPWSLPFGHKRLFADRLEQYDLFVYTEDDTLLTEAHIGAFLRAADSLPDDCVAGFLREERDAAGNRYISTAHNHFHWDPDSVIVAGGEQFAYFTNEHAALFLLTRDQLRRAIHSGGFLVDPHQSRYDLLVTAATDPYTQCGLRKLVCISQVDDFILEHLPNAYLGKLGLARADFDLQLRALSAAQRGERSRHELLQTESKTWHARWSKSYYEPADADLVNAVGTRAVRVLSIGCGSGSTEAALRDGGHEVCAIALDSVIGALAEARGLEVLCGSRPEVVVALKGRCFDVIVLSNVLHLIEDPVEFLRDFAEFLAADGRWIVRTPNFAYLPTLIKRARGTRGFRGLNSFAAVGLHLTTASTVRRWLRTCCARRFAVHSTVNPRWARIDRLTGGLLASRLSKSIIVIGHRSQR